MNILITILLTLVGIIVLLLIIGLFLTKNFNIESNTVIKKSKTEVFNYVKFLKNNDQYNKWAMKDPNMKKVLTGTDGTVGFTYAWDGNREAGKGVQEIIKIIENERIDYALHFEKPYKSTSYSSIILQSSLPEQTKVTWTFHGTMPYPFNVMFAVFGLGKMLNKDIAASLQHLKAIIEK
ncbi:MAG TPA: SRPBCC family protein [Bacteroidia bacterium]|nr:SRPBCC family protein [Bacteroidia bacterium]